MWPSCGNAPGNPLGHKELCRIARILRKLIPRSSGAAIRRFGSQIGGAAEKFFLRRGSRPFIGSAAAVDRSNNALIAHGYRPPPSTSHRLGFGVPINYIAFFQ